MNSIGAVSAINRIQSITSASGVSGVSGTNPVSGASTINGAGAVDGSDPTAQSSGNSFLDSLSSAFNSLNTQLTATDATMNDFAAGGSADLHTVMLQMEEASLSLKTAVQVRDKLLEAYQEIMRTQL
jgi:flagellar hook-basal body complex protein FliE